ncbi:GNAT family N-acetyltransferase [Flagellimonas hymeniacidonis]|uniref:GNAT family N-acetyltransferase n=1 Tax=Flagellimonas hymeniacidonis TaxID=2603628 RepID=A0A5C8V437_9FLAO|nr:GNAT family N-acetyltransferase [Flagellimonas hymeniacidonis]TXN35782.1 GNAT family N-acetyltransferase [Flagellimonas hymeniacidonis]
MSADFYISTEKSKMDVPLIHKYLSEESYWAKGRSEELVVKSMENALCFGVFAKDGEQIAFARIVTDFVVFAWLMDVFVVEKHQGKGIGKMLLDYIFNYPELQNVKGMGLRTNDAHSLYTTYGFESIPNPETWMFKKKN